MYIYHSMKKRLFLILFIFLYSTILFATNNPNATQELHFPKAEYIGENTVRIPFKLVDHLIVIEAEVLNRKGNFIIDTGSQNLVLNTRHFKNTNSLPSYARHSGISSDIDEVRIKWLKKLLVRNFSITNIKSDIIDLSNIESNKKMSLYGIIGYNVLKDYEIFIDFHLKQITLSRIEKNGHKIDNLPYLEEISDTINFRLKKHTIILTSFVNKQKLNFGLDTGAEVNLLDKSASKKIIENFKTPKKLIMIGASNKEVEVLAGKLYKVKLTDKVYCGPMRTIITNLSRMNIAYGTELDGVLGYEFIAMRRIIINYKKKQLYFVKLPFNN